MSFRRFHSLQDVRVDSGPVNPIHVDDGYDCKKHYSWGLISTLLAHYRSTDNLKLLGSYRAIPEEGTHHGRRQSNSRSACESPRESISKRTCQSEIGTISREERARLARERFDADRQRRLEQLKEARRQAELFREQQLLLKKKRLEEARARDFERRRSVEERRKKLEEIEKMRKESLQRKLERIERNNEARRNAGGPSGVRIFGFGSCTPREIYMSYSKFISKNGFTVVVPYTSEKEKLDRTVSTPNIAASNQKVKLRRSDSGILSQTHSLERGRRSSTIRNMSERQRPASALGQPRSEPTPRRTGSSLGVSSPSPSASSGFFDRLSQPRRVHTRSEEATPERKRSFVSTTRTPSGGPMKSCLSSKQSAKSASKKTSKTSPGDSGSSVSAKPAAVTFQDDRSDAARCDEPDQLSVVVNVEDVEADALNDVDSELDTESSRVQVTATEEEEEESDSLPNDTSAAVTSLLTDRSVSPPKTLPLAGESAKPPTIAIVHTSPTKSEPGGRSRPSSLRPVHDNGDGSKMRHPSTNALPPPSPPAMMNKGSAPSTPTGQREMPRASSTREVTEEEYRQRLAEQRRLARERMAAQEAEKARAREEEKRRREEELQRLREAAERQRREEEAEKERREAAAREEEERRRVQEEQEREEAERKEREEQEQRQMLLERERQAQLKVEEEKRQERKKRLESIMSRVKKTSDTGGSRESLTSSHLDLSSNGSEAVLETERPVSPAPQFKSALLQSMLSKGKLSTSIRAVSALRRSQGPNGSAGSLISDLQNLSRSSENLSSTSNSGPSMPTSSSGEMTTSQIENQLSPPPVVNPCMWRSHPNGIPGLGGHERDVDEPSENYEDEEVDSNPALISNSIQSRLTERHSTGKPSVAQETRRSRPNSVHFEDMVPISHGGTDRGDIVDDASTSSDADTQLMTHETVPDQWLAEEPHLSTSMVPPRSMADMMS